MMIRWLFGHFKNSRITKSVTTTKPSNPYYFEFEDLRLFVKSLRSGFATNHEYRT
jgi:hypothetical protein